MTTTDFILKLYRTFVATMISNEEIQHRMSAVYAFLTLGGAWFLSIIFDDHLYYVLPIIVDYKL